MIVVKSSMTIPLLRLIAAEENWQLHTSPDLRTQTSVIVFLFLLLRAVCD